MIKSHNSVASFNPSLSASYFPPHLLSLRNIPPLPRRAFAPVQLRLGFRRAQLEKRASRIRRFGQFSPCALICHPWLFCHFIFAVMRALQWCREMKERIGRVYLCFAFLGVTVATRFILVSRKFTG